MTMTIHVDQARQHQVAVATEGTNTHSSSTVVLVGDQLGFYRALDTLGSLTADELAEVTRTEEGYVRDWLNHEAASGRINYSPRTQRFWMSRDQALMVKSAGSTSIQARW